MAAVLDEPGPSGITPSPSEGSSLEHMDTGSTGLEDRGRARGRGWGRPSRDAAIGKGKGKLGAVGPVGKGIGRGRAGRAASMRAPPPSEDEQDEPYQSPPSEMDEDESCGLWRAGVSPSPHPSDSPSFSAGMPPSAASMSPVSSPEPSPDGVLSSQEDSSGDMAGKEGAVEVEGVGLVKGVGVGSAGVEGGVEEREVALPLHIWPQVSPS